MNKCYLVPLLPICPRVFLKTDIWLGFPKLCGKKFQNIKQPRFKPNYFYAYRFITVPLTCYLHSVLIPSLIFIVFSLICNKKWKPFSGYNTVLAITGAIRGSSREKLYQKLGLETLQQRRWYRKLCCFYKILKSQSPKYLYLIIPIHNMSYKTK